MVLLRRLDNIFVRRHKFSFNGRFMVQDNIKQRQEAIIFPDGSEMKPKELHFLIPTKLLMHIIYHEINITLLNIKC